VEAVSLAPTEPVVIGMLTVGTIGCAWGGFLLWKAGKKSKFASPLSSISTI